MVELTHDTILRHVALVLVPDPKTFFIVAIHSKRKLIKNISCQFISSQPLNRTVQIQ